MNSGTMTEERFLTGDVKSYLHIVIMVVIEIFFRWVPAFGEMTQGGMAVMGVFLGTIYGWLTIPNMGVASLTGIIMMGTTMVYPTVGDSILAALGNVNTMRILTCFGVAGLMKDSGASSYLAKKIVGMKVGQKSPMIFIFLFMVASIVIGPFVGFATLILCWGMWQEVCAVAKAPNSFLKFGITSIMIAFCLANQCFPFVPMVITLNGMWTGSTGLPPAPFVSYVSYMLLMTFVICIIWLLMGKYVMRVEAPRQTEGFIASDSEKATPYQKYILFGVAVYVILLCLGSMNFGAVSKYLEGWGLLGFSTLFVLITIYLQPRGAKNSYHHIMVGSVNWDLLATMGMVMLLAMNLSSPAVGLGTTLASSLDFLTSLGTVSFVLIIMLIPLILTQYLSNLAMGVIFIPICYSLGSRLGLNVYALNCSVYVLTSVALASPAGSLGSAMYYSHEDIDNRTGYKYGWIFTAMCYVVTLVFFVLLGDLFFPR